ncbi:Ig-like domain-containing protein [Rhodococcus maanshanensis]|uniref:Ig-like domain (Group 3) n=1 Tax=Rhodococcus maanshanensis TaxID=183556 RepID=A0A1H7J7H4_9NOCA|nr:Ig-like domain-containing protein [Rhodococcus maanshanensis]SEK70314.1 Ig-like domain (group 3) [Rhodococcus maanshanensis]
MAHRAVTRIVAAGATTAFALGTLALLGTGTANADERRIDWWDGYTHFYRTVSNETPAAGETITITTRFERGSEERIYWAKDHHNNCLTYVPGSAKIDSTATGERGVEPYLEIKPDFVAGDFTAGIFASNPIKFWGDNGANPVIFTVKYKVGENCARGTALQSGMSYNGDRGSGTYTTQGPSITVTKGGSSTALSPITGATVGRSTTLIAKVTPAAAGGTVTFKEDNRVISTVYVTADGTATAQWAPAIAGQRTITADFSGRGDLVGSRATATVTVAPAGGGSTASTTTLNPVTGAIAAKETTLKAKVTPAAAGGTIEFRDGTTVLGTAQVGADGTATQLWTPTTDGNHTITATFSGRDNVTGSTTTQQVTVAKAGTNPGPAGSLDSLSGFGS